MSNNLWNITKEIHPTTNNPIETHRSETNLTILVSISAAVSTLILLAIFCCFKKRCYHHTLNGNGFNLNHGIQNNDTEPYHQVV